MTHEGEIQTILPTQDRRRHPPAVYASVGEAVAAAPRRVTARPGARRQNAVLTLVATVLGLWFGLAAPSVSPVGLPTSLSPAVVSDAAAPLDPPAQAAPTPPAGDAAPRGTERRGDPGQGPDGLGQQGRHR